MEQKKKTLKEWLKEHKTELMIAGITVVGGVLIVKNWDWFKGLMKRSSFEEISVFERDLPDCVIQEATEMVLPQNVIKIDVCEHKRLLAGGRKASLSKIQEALEKGIELAEHETIVSAHQRCRAVA